MLISAARIYLADYFSASARLILQYIDTENKAWFPWQPWYEMAVSALCCFGFYWVRLVFEGPPRLKIGQPCRKSGLTYSLINCEPALYLFLSVQQTRRQERSHFPEKRRFPHSLSVESGSRGINYPSGMWDLKMIASPLPTQTASPYYLQKMARLRRLQVQRKVSLLPSSFFFFF